MFTFIPVILLLFASAVYSSYCILSALLGARRLSKILILLFLISSTAGFITVFYILSFYDSWLMRALYLTLSLIIGFLFYLTISGILFQFFRVIRPKTDPAMLAKIGVSVAIILFIIGSLSSLSFKVKAMEIKINGLPEAWQGKRIVHISDIHLGSIHGSGFVKKLAAKIDKLDPDYLIVTGDLFDGAPGQVDEIVPSLGLLKAREKVIFIPGNHDKYLGLDKFSPYLEETGVLILKDQSVTINNLEIIGFDFLSRKAEKGGRTIRGLRDYKGQARLLLNHVPAGIEDAKEMKVSLQLSGHSHRGQMWPVSILTNFIYGKYHYGLNTEGDFNIYTTSGVGSWGPPLRTFNRPEIAYIILR